MSGAATGDRTLRGALRADPRIDAASVDGTVLAAILNAKADRLEEMKRELPAESFAKDLVRSDRDFYGALAGDKTVFILECKKASPSKGLIRPDFDPAAIARAYADYADAISVLADEPFFQGRYEYIAAVSRAVGLPVLCKDFIIDPYQVMLARLNGADAVLLMLSVLTDTAYAELSALAASLGMGVLTEASGEREIERAVRLGARVVGINNRDLRNLTVDLNRVRRLSALVPPGRTVISESGISSHDQILSLRRHAHGFLIGSGLTARADVGLACRTLVWGENKICGITRTEDAVCSWREGALWNGLIFAKKSPRRVAPEAAAALVKEARAEGCRQGFAGVFVNEDPAAIVRIAEQTGLGAVQLHGGEDRAYIARLRGMLASAGLGTAVWKALPARGGTWPRELAAELLDSGDAERIVLDAAADGAFGGTGKTFDWSSVKDRKDRIIVAGGLGPENAARARDAAETAGLDLNSGLESAPGIKDSAKIAAAMAAIKSY